MQEEESEESTFSPSFNCYTSGSAAVDAAVRVAGHEWLNDDEFEFSAANDGGGSAISADGESDYGQIRQIFPVFSRDFDEDRDPPPPSCCSFSSDESEVDPTMAPPRRNKSYSTGSCSRRWRFLDLLRRSNSTDGSSSFVCATPDGDPKKTTKGNNKGEKIGKAKARRGVGDSGGEELSSAMERLYVKNRALKEGEKRRSNLPYRKNLVGFFARVDGLGR